MPNILGSNQKGMGLPPSPSAPSAPGNPEDNSGWGFLVGLGRSATAGLSRIPATAVLAASRKLAGVKTSWGEDYKDTKGYYDQLQENNPKASIAGEMVGAVVPGAGIAKVARAAQVAAKAAPTTARVATNIAANAGLGATNAAMDDTDIGEGAVIGGAAGAAGEALGSAWNKFAATARDKATKFVTEKVASERAKLPKDFVPFKGDLSDPMLPSEAKSFQDIAKIDPGIADGFIRNPVVMERFARNALGQDLKDIGWGALKGALAHQGSDYVQDKLGVPPEYRPTVNVLAGIGAAGNAPRAALKELAPLAAAVAARTIGKSTSRNFGGIPSHLFEYAVDGEDNELGQLVKANKEKTLSTTPVEKAAGALAVGATSPISKIVAANKVQQDTDPWEREDVNVSQDPWERDAPTPQKSSPTELDPWEK